MKVTEIQTDEAAGHVLMHDFVAADGTKLLPKGRTLGASEVALLRSAGADRLRVAVMEPGDVGEDEAAAALAAMLAGGGLTVSRARRGRVDLTAAAGGLFQVDAAALLTLNCLPGVAIATAPNDEPVPARRRVVSVKVVPYAVPGATLDAARGLCGGEGPGPVVCLKPFVLRTAVLLTTGQGGPNVAEPKEGGGATTRPGKARGEVAAAFLGPLRERLTVCGMEMIEGPCVGADEREIREALESALAGEAEMVLIAGNTSIADAEDVTPRAIRASGAEIVQFGVPVEPGSLLLLAYHGQKPIVGVPGCVRGKHRNAFDLVLPRLAAGDRLTRQDLLALGHGGLLE